MESNREHLHERLIRLNKEMRATFVLQIPPFSKMKCVHKQHTTLQPPWHSIQEVLCHLAGIVIDQEPQPSGPCHQNCEDIIGRLATLDDVKAINKSMDAEENHNPHNSLTCVFRPFALECSGLRPALGIILGVF